MMGYLWKHCENGHELRRPTVTDRILGYTVCPKCDAHELIDDDERRSGVQELLDRLESLEARVPYTEND